MDAHIFLLYLATWSLVALTPGPAVMCAMTHATRFGMRSAMAGILGIQSGHLIFFGCVAGGLAALLSTATTAFTVLRTIGAFYLLYLGARIILATFRTSSSITTEASTPAPAPAHTSLFLQGFAIQVTNPKALLFMSALLPQFIQPGRSLPLQITILLATTIVIDAAVLTGYAMLAQHGTRTLRTSALTRWMERTFGAALIFFGLRLLTAKK